MKDIKLTWGKPYYHLGTFELKQPNAKSNKYHKKKKKEMKTELTVEQSAKLIELGVSSKLASQYLPTLISTGKGIQRLNDDSSIFTLTDILSILPKEIKFGITTYHLNIDYPPINQVAARYIDEDDEDNDLKGFMCDELIDSLYLLLIWVIEIGFVKLNTEKK